MAFSVLLVDDSAVQAATRRMILERAGYHVTVSLDAKNALDLLLAPGGAQRFSLVITDHMMPRLGGVEFVEALRRMCEALPVVVLSGLAEAEQEYEDLGVQFHQKPMPPDQLLATVARLLDDPPMFKSA